MGSDRATGGPTPASAAGLHDCLWRLRHNRDSAAKALCPCFSTSGTGAQGPMAQCCHQFQVGGQRHRPGHGPGDCPESQADPTGREGLVEKGRMDFASVCSTCHNQTPQTGWLTRQTCVVSHCGRQVRGRGAGGAGSFRGVSGRDRPQASLLGLSVATFSLRLYMAFSLRSCLFLTFFRLRHHSYGTEAHSKEPI